MNLLYCVMLLLLSGCGVYHQSVKDALAPDGFDLHATVNQDGSPTGGFGGFSWDLN